MGVAACGKDTPSPQAQKPEVTAKTPDVAVPSTVFESTDAASETGTASGSDPEPNDTPESAISLRSGQPVTGLIGAPLDSRGRDGDQDWYVLTVPDGEPVVARADLVGVDDLDVVLEWANPKLQRRGKYRAIVQADAVIKTPGPETLVAIALKPGKHYFRVREAWYRKTKRKASTSPYTLTVTTGPWQAGVDIEPNDKDPEALSTAFETLGEGLIGHVGDHDLWRIDIPPEVAATHLRVTIDAVKGLAMTGVLSRTPQGEQLRNGRGAANAPLVFRNVGAPPIVEGQARSLYVRVGAHAGANVQNRYSVKVEAEVARTDGAATETEPNDGTDSATVVAIPGVALARKLPASLILYGHIDHRRDRDFFTVTVDKPTSLAATLTPPMKADYALDVLGPAGTKPVSASATRAGQNEIARGLLLTPGKWHIVVRRQRGKADDAGAYALTLEMSDGANTESEPNNKPGDRLVTLVAGKMMQGWLSPATDKDYWTVDLSAAASGAIVTFKLKAPTGASLKAGLYTKDTKVLTVSERLVGEASFTHFLEPGIYLLNVWNEGKPGTAASDPYGVTMLE